MGIVIGVDADELVWLEVGDERDREEEDEDKAGLVDEVVSTYFRATRSRYPEHTPPRLPSRQSLFSWIVTANSMNLRSGNPSFWAETIGSLDKE